MHRPVLLSTDRISDVFKPLPLAPFAVEVFRRKPMLERGTRARPF
jgi:hypothetical protein